MAWPRIVFVWGQWGVSWALPTDSPPTPHLSILYLARVKVHAVITKTHNTFIIQVISGFD